MGVFKTTFLKGLKPEPKLTVSEWADQYRVLSSRSSSEPGIWRTSRTPYTKEIMDVLSIDHPCKEVVFKKSAQIGGTEVGLNWIGYSIDHDPAPMMLVMPTVEMAKRNSKQRIDPMITASDRLSAKIKPARSRDSGNTILQKDFPGGTLIMTGANSGVGLRSSAVKRLMADEIDGYPSDVDGEGDPIKLAMARTRTFANRKIFLCSTPTVEALSRISPAYEASDQRKYHVPCPHCGEFQELLFENLKWPKKKPRMACYYCSHCGAEIEEHNKTKMLQAGKWIAQNPKEKFIVGFHLNALYSPLGWLSWGEIAFDWIEAQKSKDKLKGFINTILGETWKDRGDAPDWNRLYERREKYKFRVVPPGVCFLTAGADVQKDRIEVEVVGWGRNKVSWSIDYMVFEGDTSSLSNKVWWDFADFVLNYSFPVGSEDSEKYMMVMKIGLDSGYNTQTVYSFVRNYDPNQTRLVAIKGQDNLSIPVGQPKYVDVDYMGKKVRRGVRLWNVGSTMLKSEIYGYLRLNKAIDGEEDPGGYCHFPQYGEEFFKQLTSEEMVIKKIRGYSKPEWQKIRERNEALDCRVYARAAASIIGIDRFKEEHFRKLENDVGIIHNKKETKNDEANQSNEKTKFKIRKRKKRESSSFWD